MRVLLSAYACEPGAGSERGKGWNYAVELGRQGHEVTVLTCGSHHRAAIEAHVAAHGTPSGLRFAWHDVPRWPGPGYDDARHIRFHYLLWQFTARRAAARLVAREPADVIHHLTWTVLRWPSCLGGLGPRFVFGPVGGGEVAPWRLRRGLPRRGWSTELKRDLINLWSRVDPLVRFCLRRADVILVTDEATLRHVPLRHRAKAVVVADVFAPPVPSATRRVRRTGPPAILFAGRLEYWKGAQLALGAVTHLRAHHPGLTFSLAGTGPEEAYLRGLVHRLGLTDYVRFLGPVPHTEMSWLYAAHDLLLFPSLHDSGPHVIGEALAHGVPVVCLDLGGPGIAVDETCGAAVSTRQRSRLEVERALADAAGRILDDPSDRYFAGAIARARSLDYSCHVDATVRAFYRAPTVRRALKVDLGLAKSSPDAHRISMLGDLHESESRIRSDHAAPQYDRSALVTCFSRWDY